MAAPTSANSVSQLIATTREKIATDELIDQILKSKPGTELFRKVMKAGSGNGLKVHLFAGDDDTVVADDAGTFNTGRSGDVITDALFPWSMPVVSKARVNWRKAEMNAGSATQLVNFAKATWDRAVEGHGVRLDKLVHGTDAAQAAAGVVGLVDIIGTGPLAGVDPAVAGNEFWKSTVRTSSRAAESIKVAFREILMDIEDASGGMANVTVALCGRSVYREYQDSLDAVAQAQIGENAKAVDTEFTEFRHNGLLLRYDASLDTNTALLIDESDLVAEYLNDNFMKAHDEQVITGTFETVRPLGTVFALGVKARNRHGKLVRTA